MWDIDWETLIITRETLETDIVHVAGGRSNTSLYLEASWFTSARINNLGDFLSSTYCLISWDTGNTTTNAVSMCLPPSTPHPLSQHVLHIPMQLHALRLPFEAITFGVEFRWLKQLERVTNPWGHY